jgi:hypothetical protein
MKLNFSCGGSSSPSNGLVHMHFINPSVLSDFLLYITQPGQWLRWDGPASDCLLCGRLTKNFCGGLGMERELNIL